MTITRSLLALARASRQRGVAYPPGAPGVNLDPVYSLGVRLVFEWRRYY